MSRSRKVRQNPETNPVQDTLTEVFGLDRYAPRR